MCGYFGYLVNEWQSKPIFKMLGIDHYPAGTRYSRRVVQGLVTRDGEGESSISDAFWWYAQKRVGNSGETSFVPDYDVTTFNARALDRPYWKDALHYRRGLFIASEFGEAQGTKRHLFRSSDPILLGALYKDWYVNGEFKVRSCAVVTRPPHHKLAPFHEKSSPLFLPSDKTVIEAWLDPSVRTNPLIQALLNEPNVFNDFAVHSVKTYKDDQRTFPLQWIDRD